MKKFDQFSMAVDNVIQERVMVVHSKRAGQPVLNTQTITCEVDNDTTSSRDAATNKHHSNNPQRVANLSSEEKQKYQSIRTREYEFQDSVNQTQYA